MPGNSELAMKLESAETKLQDLKSNMAILGKEAAAAMAAVEAQQQRLTLQRLIAMVMLKQTAYHQRVLQVLDQLEARWHQNDNGLKHLPPKCGEQHAPPPSYEEINGVYASQAQNGRTDSMGHAFIPCQSDVELTLSIGDYVVVTNNGWAEGECKGKAGCSHMGTLKEGTVFSRAK
uniref:SH3 domain-containing protein n=1 Tax=Salix viminalis TaxID=40686 RepID=A0A6N2LQV9_SALVM